MLLLLLSKSYWFSAVVVVAAAGSKAIQRSFDVDDYQFAIMERQRQEIYVDLV